VAQLKTCTVAHQKNGIKRSVDVQAVTLFEAAVLGMTDLGMDIGDDNYGSLEITVKSPEVKHEVAIPKVKEWYVGKATSRKRRLQMVLYEKRYGKGTR
jgi:hypothetical protein